MVLAAGSSTRLGRPKQLVVHDGLPLVVRAVRAALDTGANPVVVVLGRDADAIRHALSDLPVAAVVNGRWTDGIGTSVAAGVHELVVRAPATTGVMVLLTDQPMVGAPALGRLIGAWVEANTQSPNGVAIAAAQYAETVGVPAVFGRAHFEALCMLSPAAGAAQLLRAARTSVLRVAMPEAAIDIDTPEDLRRLRSNEFRSASPLDRAVDPAPHATSPRRST